MRSPIKLLIYSFLLSYTLLGIRTRSSLDRFPADPGYDYVLSAQTIGIRSWFNLDPYLHIGAHFVSWVVGLFTLSSQAVVMSMSVHLVWALTGCGLLLVLKREGRSPLILTVGVVALALCPAAAESALGNVGNLKWPLITVAMVAASSSVAYTSPRAWSCYFIVSGFTNPLLPLVLAPLVLLYRGSGRDDRKALRIPIAAVVMTLIIQVSVVGLRGVSQGRGDSRIYEPWPGMGLFWWFGMLSPTFICLVYLLLAQVTKHLRKDPFLKRMSIGTIVLAVASIAYGGIGDRYFVAPMILSWIILVAATEEVARRLRPKTQFALISLVLLALAVPTVKWFSSSWYLISGPQWSAEIKRAEDLCKVRGGKVTLQVGTDNMTELSCQYILDRS